MDNNSEVVYLYLDDIIPNRFQPREIFDDQALKELAVSIKEHGVIQPIIVRQVENKYEIIAGERRYKASTMAGLTKIPAIVKNYDDKESSKVALIENLQRKDLTPIEEARTYQKILELENDMTQEQLASTLGKTQSSVSNKLRLLALPDEIQDALLKEKISERHARSLLNIEDKNEQIKMMERVITDKMTVRELDKLIKEMKEGPGGTEEVTKVDDNMNYMQDITNLMNNANTTSNVSVANNSLSASDILKEDVEENPTEVNVQDQDVHSGVSLNPTEVDINKIRESAVDIGGTIVPTEPETIENGETFKFVPTFGTRFVSTKEEPTKAIVEDKFSKLFDSNSSASTETSVGVNSANTQVEANSNVASSIESVGLTVASTSNDVATAVNDIKATVDSLKDNGYDISLEEIDDSSNYKITISIKKDA